VAEVERAIGEHGVHVHAEVRQSVAWPEADRRLSPACEAVVALVREEMPVVTEDRSLSAGLRALARRVAAGDVLAAAQAEVPLTESGNG
jgi:histidine ammonia-lyase